LEGPEALDERKKGTQQPGEWSGKRWGGLREWVESEKCSIENPEPQTEEDKGKCNWQQMPVHTIKDLLQDKMGKGNGKTRTQLKTTFKALREQVAMGGQLSLKRKGDTRGKRVKGHY